MLANERDVGCVENGVSDWPLSRAGSGLDPVDVRANLASSSVLCMTDWYSLACFFSRAVKSSVTVVGMALLAIASQVAGWGERSGQDSS